MRERRFILSCLFSTKRKSNWPRMNANEHESETNQSGPWAMEAMIMTEKNRPPEDTEGRKHWQLCHDIVQVFYAVYNELGFGFLEEVYEEAFALALIEAGFTVSRQ